MYTSSNYDACFGVRTIAMIIVCFEVGGIKGN